MTHISHELLDELRTLDAACTQEASKHSRVIVLISACIVSGIDTGPQIIAALGELGFNRRHAGIVLHSEAGSHRGAHRWQRTADGRYRLHEEV
jgi:hypothetical protein